MTLKINNLSKNFGDRRGIKNISLEIGNGEIFGVYGADGAGKTTFINVVAGSADADAGSIFFDDREVTSANRAKYGFKNFSSADDSLWTALDDSDGSGLLPNSEKLLSASENPSNARVLLLDNAFQSVNTAAREEKLLCLKNVAEKNNQTIIFATDDFNEIFLICDRAAFLCGGEIVQTGTPREIYENPNSAFVAQSTGRINLIEVKRSNASDSGSPEFQTLTGNYRIFTDKPEKNSFGAAAENAMLGIRPEHISISFGASFPEDNLIRARISGVKYLGATTLIELDAFGLQLQALVLRLVGLKIGDECMVGLPPNRILVFEN